MAQVFMCAIVALRETIFFLGFVMFEIIEINIISQVFRVHHFQVLPYFKSIFEFSGQN